MLVFPGVWKDLNLYRDTDNVRSASRYTASTNSRPIQNTFAAQGKTPIFITLLTESKIQFTKFGGRPLPQRKNNEFLFVKDENGRIRLPANLKANEKSRTYPPDLESHVYVKYTHRRNVLKLNIYFNWFVATLRKEFKTQGTMYHHTKTLSRDNITFLTV